MTLTRFWNVEEVLKIDALQKKVLPYAVNGVARYFGKEPPKKVVEVVEWERENPSIARPHSTQNIPFVSYTSRPL